MGKKVLVSLVTLALGLVMALLFAHWIPALPAKFASHPTPFYAVVMHDDSLALVAHLEEADGWVKLDATRTPVDPAQCRCPVLPPDGDLLSLQAFSQLEMIEVRTLAPGTFELAASRDDLGGPKVRYTYHCGETGISPLLESAHILGLPVPMPPLDFVAAFLLIWCLAAWAIFRFLG